ncbi:hypothetical protein [Acuticoccus kandeliae]|uniref:hypothetical protein n=1 Tax=Acuticoccus kandeliae TaxID=2073160 RepID=UPI001300A9E2|nr:hypothetical protein [Acuticoccus kandeliae]
MPIGQDSEATIAIRAICARQGGGRVITMGCPGLETDHRGDAWLSPESRDATLAGAVAAGMRLLIILAQRDELPEGAVAELKTAARALGVPSIHLPIEDFSVPSRPFLHAWRRLEPVFGRLFADDHAIGMCCQHGAGRSGIVAAMHLIDAGSTPTDAIDAMRAQFPETIENTLQYRWLEDYQPGAA